jgi:hypothetical protein
VTPSGASGFRSASNASSSRVFTKIIFDLLFGSKQLNAFRNPIENPICFQSAAR